MTLTDAYEGCAEEYATHVAGSLSRALELRAMRELLGPLQGRSVIDLACGDGCFGRHLLQHGAARVVGVDCSAGMVERGRRVSAQLRDGMEFIESDVAMIDDIGPFDIVISAWLLCSMETEEMLRTMYCRIATLLAPGGCLVAQFNHPLFEPVVAGQSIYGAHIQRITDGDSCPRLHVDFVGCTGAGVVDYQWSAQQHEDAARAAGLQVDGWAQPVPNAIEQAAQPRGFWDDYLGNSAVVLLRCTKPDSTLPE